MPRFIMVAKTDSRTLALAFRTAAEERGFTIERGDEADEYELNKGSLGMSVCFGAFVDYCRFRLLIDEGRREGTLEAVLEYNVPWWTGLLFMGRNKELSGKIIDDVEEILHEEGGKVLNVIHEK